MRDGWMYILECCDGGYYVGSTIDLPRRLEQHQSGQGANYTRKRLPVKLVYCEFYDLISKAYQRERQIHGWTRKKKEALIKGEHHSLPALSRSKTSRNTL